MRWVRFRPGGAVALAGALLVSFVLTAPALSDPICDSLSAQLANIPRAKSWTPAGAGLMRELREMLFAARQKVCGRGGGGFGFFGMMQSPYCPEINWRMAQLRRQMSGAAREDPAARYQRQRILRAMADNGCSVPQRQPRLVTSGRLRTLCVRACDGYFFPISYATSRKRLKIDEAVCKGMYPEGEATLFVNRSGDESERAVSLKGQAYTAQPYAYGFRKNFVPACKAKLTTGLAGLGERFAAAQAEFLKSGKGRTRVAAGKARPPAPVPLQRPASWEDPETLANRAGGFAIAPPVPVIAETEPTGRAVRIVGEGLFPLPVGVAENDAPPLFPPGRMIRERQPVKASVFGDAGE
jgi:hypothetical protein